jgi:hypothetical protein
MSRRIDKKTTKLSRSIEKAVNDAFVNSFAGVLKDIEYRIETLMDVGIGAKIGVRSKVNSRDLNLASPILEGFVITDNSPSAGYVKWTGCNMVYKGVNVAITDGNTNSTYVWWKYSATPNTVFQTSNTFPTLTVYWLHTSPTQLVVSNTFPSLTDANIAANTITASQIQAGSITGDRISGGMITGCTLKTNSTNNYTVIHDN